MEKVPFQISLAAARVNAGLTQQEVAEKMGVSNVTVVAWEKGKVEIKPPYLSYFCEICGIKPEYIFLPNKLT
ncbi:MAG TPA: helix-turn-helix transcriptional regulator [Lachnospiraceae bacterium]